MMIDECILKATFMSGDCSERTLARLSLHNRCLWRRKTITHSLECCLLAETFANKEDSRQCGRAWHSFKRFFSTRSLFSSRGAADWLILKARSLASWRHRVLFTSTQAFASHNSRPVIRVLSSYTRSTKTLLTQKTLSTTSETGAKT